MTEKEYPIIFNFIQEHFEPDEADDMEKLILSMNMLKIFNNTVIILQEDTFPKDEVVISNLATGLLSSVTYKAGKIKDPFLQLEVLGNYARLIERLLTMLVSNNVEKSDIIFETLEKSLQVCCFQFGLDYKQLRHYFDFFKIKLVVNSLKNVIPAHKDETDKIKRKQRYVWLNQGSLAKLTDILFKENYIKSKREFFDLFLKPIDGLVVRWNEEKKNHLPYILNRLFSDGFAKIEGNKGYFSYAEKHFITYANSFFAHNTLKNISSKIKSNPEEFSFIIEDVDLILNSITDK